jgi:hypothetical protein
MRKIFLFFAALTIAVAANAFTLHFNNEGKNFTITSAVDNLDVLEDGGSVAVVFDAENKTINVTFVNATLKSDVNGELLYFKYDESYTDVKVKLIGKNYLIGEGQWTQPIKIDGPVGGGKVFAHLTFEAGAPGSELNISGKSILIQFNYNSKMTFGNLLTVNITSTSENQAVFYGSCGNDDSGELWLYCSLNVKTTGNNQIFMKGGSGPAYLKIDTYGKIRTEGVTVKDNTFVKDDAPYKGDLVYVYSVPIAIGNAGEVNTYVYPDEECKPAGLKSGTITFDMATYVLTLDNVDLDKSIAAMIDDFTIYLKGNNIISNSNSKMDPRISVMGYNFKLAGESDATLTIDGNNVCDGLFPFAGLEIDNFGKLTIKNANNGITGNGGKNAEDVLKLHETPMDIQSANGAIVDFGNIVLLTNYMKWSPAASYNPTTYALEDEEGNILNDVVYSKVTAIDQVVNDKVASGKFIRNGQLYILRDGKTLTVTGQEVK